MVKLTHVVRDLYVLRNTIWVNINCKNNADLITFPNFHVRSKTDFPRPVCM